MEKNSEVHLKTDDNKVINIKSITWVKKIDECLAVCTKSDGETHKICKSINIDSFTKLNKYFEE